jgi:hypothetical protein
LTLAHKAEFVVRKAVKQVSGGVLSCMTKGDRLRLPCVPVPAGTLRLREAMSKQLVKMAATARPTLMAAAQEQLVALRAELASLPPAAVLGDGHAEMLRLIDDVSANIHVSLPGHC